MEQKLLGALTTAVAGLSLPKPVDLRGLLVPNMNAQPWHTRSIDKLKGLVWHQELGWSTVEDVHAYHTGANSHLAEGGVETIAYTLAIRRNGQICLCNDLHKATWSQGYAKRAGDENTEFISVMYEGNFNYESGDPAGEPNDDQILAGMILWDICKCLWGWDAFDLYGHFDFGKPACPGRTLSVIIAAVRANRPRVKDYDFTKVTGRMQALADTGFYAGAIDGIPGKYFHMAIRKFQMTHGLVADGLWGKNTERKMRSLIRG